MKNRNKEYISIALLTLFQGIFTYKFLGGMPYIAFGIWSKVTVSAFLMWMIYGTVLCFITQKWVMKCNITVKCSVRALGFGIGIAVIKGGFDFVVEKCRGLSASVVEIVLTDQITNFLFGILIIMILFLVIAKNKIYVVKKSIKIPICILSVILLWYSAIIGNYIYRGNKEIKMYNFTEVEIEKMDYYLGMKILDINVWFYVMFYIAFWWFMRRLTEKARAQQ